VVFVICCVSFPVVFIFIAMTPNQNTASDQDSFSGSVELTKQIAELIRLVRSGEEVNIQLALLLAKSLGHPPAFRQYLDELLLLYQLVFKSQRKKLDAAALTKFFGLTQLHIANRKLTALPESIGQLHNLQRLNCSKNQLQSLPESIGQLQKLKSLYCNGNQLQALPESLAQLHNLQELNCAHNKLKTLPESIGQLHNLQSLDCRYNSLQALPESLAALPKLKRLDARGNPLIHIPPALRKKEGLELLVD